MRPGYGRGQDAHGGHALTLRSFDRRVLSGVVFEFFESLCCFSNFINLGVLRTPLSQDIAKNAAPHLKAATKFYASLAERASASAHVVDVFACSLDQVGLHEMRVCIDRTGGVVVLGDSFTQSVFKESLRQKRHSVSSV